MADNDKHGGEAPSAIAGLVCYEGYHQCREGVKRSEAVKE